MKCDSRQQSYASGQGGEQSSYTASQGDWTNVAGWSTGQDNTLPSGGESSGPPPPYTTNSRADRDCSGIVAHIARCALRGVDHGLDEGFFRNITSVGPNDVLGEVKTGEVTTKIYMWDLTAEDTAIRRTVPYQEEESCLLSNIADIAKYRWGVRRNVQNCLNCSNTIYGNVKNSRTPLLESMIQ
ncbi:uncharacterized protein L203_104908 [Cryptococcus depauperatus CBS 7841]|uniref:Uncharacterized protein n=1 Tax=Cryptococcus depauperatus CBS 7841 TaxID=1295531 RepID=A0A1E3IMY7_9TREE|nr:hypothetical protein L203_01884 [Cryptococcus depauperatus CBS 7841]